MDDDGRLRGLGLLGAAVVVWPLFLAGAAAAGVVFIPALLYFVAWFVVALTLPFAPGALVLWLCLLWASSRVASRIALRALALALSPLLPITFFSLVAAWRQSFHPLSYIASPPVFVAAAIFALLIRPPVSRGCDS